MVIKLRSCSVFVATAAVVIGGLLAARAASATEDCPESIGMWPQGSALAIAVTGEYVVLGSGRNLQIVDVSDPTTPTTLASKSFPDVVSAVAVSGDLVYLGYGGWDPCGMDNRDAGLRIIDISKPSLPTEIGSSEGYPWGILNPKGIAVSGDRVFVVHSSLLNVIDAGVPSSLRLVGGVGLPSFAEDVAVSGANAFVADGDAGLRIIDIQGNVEVGHVEI